MAQDLYTMMRGGKDGKRPAGGGTIPTLDELYDQMNPGRQGGFAAREATQPQQRAKMPTAGAPTGTGMGAPQTPQAGLPAIAGTATAGPAPMSPPVAEEPISAGASRLNALGKPAGAPPAITPTPAPASTSSTAPATNPFTNPNKTPFTPEQQAALDAWEAANPDAPLGARLDAVRRIQAGETLTDYVKSESTTQQPGWGSAGGLTDGNHDAEDAEAIGSINNALAGGIGEDGGYGNQGTLEAAGALKIVEDMNQSNISGGEYNSPEEMRDAIAAKYGPDAANAWYNGYMSQEDQMGGDIFTEDSLVSHADRMADGKTWLLNYMRGYGSTTGQKNALGLQADANVKKPGEGDFRTPAGGTDDGDGPSDSELSASADEQFALLEPGLDLEYAKQRRKIADAVAQRLLPPSALTDFDAQTAAQKNDLKVKIKQFMLDYGLREDAASWAKSEGQQRLDLLAQQIGIQQNMTAAQIDQIRKGMEDPSFLQSLMAILGNVAGGVAGGAGYGLGTAAVKAFSGGGGGGGQGGGGYGGGYGGGNTYNNGQPYLNWEDYGG